ncbi:MAG: hypothetical protein VCD00_14100 [Candidatus Hydrogenedentota bacterium]
MTERPFVRTILLGLAAICLASYSYADTLELQNGDLLEGMFKGGTQNSIRFSVDGDLKIIPVTDILALTISRKTQVAEVVEPAPEVEKMPVAPPAPVAVPVVVQADILAPAGTPLLVRFVDPIDSRQHKVGHRFAVKLESDFVHNGNVIARRGTQLYGVLVDANQAGRIKGKTHLTLELKDIRINDRLHPIVTSEYKLAGTKSSGKRSTLKILGGAALGAIIKDDDRGKGALIGAGAGIGASAITQGEQITIPRETLIEFRLGAPFTL